MRKWKFLFALQYFIVCHPVRDLCSEVVWWLIKRAEAWQRHQIRRTAGRDIVHHTFFRTTRHWWDWYWRHVRRLNERALAKGGTLSLGACWNYGIRITRVLNSMNFLFVGFAEYEFLSDSSLALNVHLYGLDLFVYARSKFYFMKVAWQSTRDYADKWHVIIHRR